MRWVFRLAVLASMVMLLLPGNEPERDMVYYGLKSAVLKTMNYCDRNPEFCDRSRAALHRATTKAKETLSELAANRAQTHTSENRSARSRNTLGSDDYDAQWQLP